MEFEPEPIVHLTGTLSLDEIAFENPIFTVDPEDLNQTEKEECTEIRDVYKHERLEPYRLECDSFEKIKLGMKKLTPDGMVLKKIETEGYGEIPKYDVSEDKYLLEYYYAAYTESKDMPFDIVIRGIHKPKRVRIGNLSIIPGLEIALKSMKRGERASFLVHPHLAYRDGQPPRIPKQATILFVVELWVIKINTNDEDEDEHPSFEKIMEEVEKICNSGTAKKRSGDNNSAIRKYRRAEALLGKIHFANEEEEKVGNKKFVTIYSNLAICYLSDHDFRKVCTAFNNAKYRDPKAVFNHVKLLYNSARALRMLGNYQAAKSRILQALKIAPSDRDILSELKKIRESAIDTRKKETELFKKMLGFENDNADREVTEFMNDNKEFLEEVSNILKEFKLDPERNGEIDVSTFTVKELECFERECRKQDVRLRKKDSKIILMSDAF